MKLAILSVALITIIGCRAPPPDNIDAALFCARQVENDCLEFFQFDSDIECLDVIGASMAEDADAGCSTERQDFNACFWYVDGDCLPVECANSADAESRALDECRSGE